MCVHIGGEPWHGFDGELLEEMEKLAREFFMLPLEEEEPYPMAPGGIQAKGTPSSSTRARSSPGATCWRSSGSPSSG